MALKKVRRSRMRRSVHRRFPSPLAAHRWRCVYLIVTQPILEPMCEPMRERLEFLVGQWNIRNDPTTNATATATYGAVAWMANDAEVRTLVAAIDPGLLKGCDYLVIEGPGVTQTAFHTTNPDSARKFVSELLWSAIIDATGCIWAGGTKQKYELFDQKYFDGSTQMEGGGSKGGGWGRFLHLTLPPVEEKWVMHSDAKPNTAYGDMSSVVAKTKGSVRIVKLPPTDSARVAEWTRLLKAACVVLGGSTPSGEPTLKQTVDALAVLQSDAAAAAAAPAAVGAPGAPVAAVGAAAGSPAGAAIAAAGAAAGSAAGAPAPVAPGTAQDLMTVAKAAWKGLGEAKVVELSVSIVQNFNGRAKSEVELAIAQLKSPWGAELFASEYPGVALKPAEEALPSLPVRFLFAARSDAARSEKAHALREHTRTRPPALRSLRSDDSTPSAHTPPSERAHTRDSSPTTLAIAGRQAAADRQHLAEWVVYGQWRCWELQRRWSDDGVACIIRIGSGTTGWVCLPRPVRPAGGRWCW